MKKSASLLAPFLYVIVFLLIMGANPFANQNISPVALLGKYPGWASHEFSSLPTYPERSDVLDAMLPQKKFFKESLWGGDDLSWNALASGGRPAIWDPTRPFLNIPNLAFVLFSDVHGYYLEILIKLLICAMGMYLLLRCWVDKVPAFVGGLVFALCGFNVSWLHWPQVTTAMWGPWLFWGAMRWFRLGEIRYLFAVAFALTFMFMGGFPVVFFYFIYAQAFLVLALAAGRVEYADFWKKLLVLGFVFFSSVVILAPFVVSLLDFLSIFDFSYRSGGSALRPEDWRIAFNPTLSGVERNYYSGIVAILGSLVVIGAFFAVLPKYRIPIVWGAITLFFAAAIGLQIIPVEYSKNIPFIGGSPKGRLAVLYGFSVALLFSIFVQFLLDRKSSVIIYFIVLPILCIQVFDQMRAFRYFNSVANGEDFYPRTPVIEYISEHIQSLQSGFFNNHYMTAGALNYYGIRDWFAHDFKTNDEKKIIKELFFSDPFSSPTSILPKPGSVRLDSDLFERLGIRYATLDKNFKIRNQVLIDNKPALPMNGERGANAQVIVLEEPMDLGGFGVLLATYQGDAPDGVRLTIYSEGLTVASSMPTQKIRDNAEAVFEFDPPLHLEVGEYVFAISFDPSPERKLTAWMTDKPQHPADRIISNGDLKNNSAWIYAMYASAPDQIGNWRLVKDVDEPKILLYENIKTPKGPYFSKDMERGDIFEDNVEIKSYRSSRIDVSYSGSDAGYVVLPARYFNGWRVERNGKIVTPDKYLGVLLAAKVDGPAELSFFYDPPHLRESLILSASGFFLLFATVYFYRRRGKLI